MANGNPVGVHFGLANPGGESPDFDCPALAVDDPVLADSVAAVEIELLTPIATRRRRSEDLDYEVGRAAQPAEPDACAVRSAVADVL